MQEEQVGEEEQAAEHRALPLDLPEGGSVGGQLGQGRTQFVPVGFQHQVDCVGAALDQVREKVPHGRPPQDDAHQGQHPGGPLP